MENRATSIAVFVVLSTVPLAAHAATIVVGPSDDYRKIESAKAGDTVLIAPGTYKFRVFLSQAGTQSAPIVIRAQDPSNRPVWDLTGTPVNSWPGSYTAGDNDRGCWQVRNAYYDISGIVFRGCHSDANENAGGIRFVQAHHLTIRDCLFQNDDNGIIGNGDDVLVEFSEFDHNGTPTSDQEHSIYFLGGSKFTLRYSYVHDALHGQNFHSRAAETVLEYNWFARAGDYEGDLQTNSSVALQTLFLRGNVFIGKDNPDNSSKVLTLFNDTNAPNLAMKLTAVWNTFIVRANPPPAIVQLGNDRLTNVEVEFSNNVVVGTTRAWVVAAPGTANWSVTGTKNWFPTGADVGALSQTIFGADPGFRNAAALDFAPGATSQLLGQADTGVGGPPVAEYYKDETTTAMFRWRNTVKDIGAFESSTAGEGLGPGDAGPPPSRDGGGPIADGGAGVKDGGRSTDQNDGAPSTPNGALDSGGSSPHDSSSGDDNRAGCACAVRSTSSAGSWVCLVLAASGLAGAAARRRERDARGGHDVWSRDG